MRDANLFPKTYLETIHAFNRPAEATSYRAAVRTARGVVEDLGATAASQSGGLTELAHVSERHSESSGHQVIAKKYKLALPIPLTKLKKAPGVSYPGDLTMLKLKDWFDYIVGRNVFHMLVGLYKADKPRERAILKAFWTNFRSIMPDHSMFRLVDEGRLDLSRTVPLILHGDEGRGRKKAPFLVLSWHSALGFVTEAANRARTHKPYVSMKCNFSESTHLHRLVTCALPKMVHDDHALQDLLQHVANDANYMMRTGVKDVEGKTHFAVCIYCCGDWVWLAKAGHFNRSFSNVQKRPLTERSIPRGICHLCQAGQAGVPWENYKEYNPNDLPPWLPTMHVQTPWTQPSPLNQIPFVPGQEAGFYAYDLFHAYHLGVGKTFMASCLALASERCMGGRVDERLEQLTFMWRTWAEENHDKAYLSSLTRASLGWPDANTFPNGQWAKGHVTTSLTEFFLDWANAQDLTADPLLGLCKEAALCIATALRVLYRSDVWLPKDVAHIFADNGLRFLSLYRILSVRSYRSGRALFSHMPKGHVMDHIFISVKISALAHDYTLSPLCTSVQMDEDYIGRVSRLSRRTNPGQTVKRVLQRCLIASYIGNVLA